MASPFCVTVDDSFGPYAQSCRGGFDLTLLFEETILGLLVVSLLLLLAPYRVASLLRKDHKKIYINYLLHCKIVSTALGPEHLQCNRSNFTYISKIFYILLVGSQIGALVLWTRPSSVVTRASTANAALALVGSAALLALSYAEHIYSLKPSSIACLFLLFSTLFDATRTRTLWLQGYNRPNAIVALVATLLKLALLALEATEKRHALRPEFLQTPPEAASGILTRWLFLWQLPLFRAGYSKQLDIDDLFDLDKHLKSLYLQTLFQLRWENGSSSSIPILQRNHC